MDTFDDEAEELIENVHVLEAGQIGFRLANEVRNLREKLLLAKQETRIALVSNQNTQEENLSLRSCVKNLSADVSQLLKQLSVKDEEIAILRQKVESNKNLEADLLEQLKIEKKKTSILREELEKSLHDDQSVKSAYNALQSKLRDYQQHQYDSSNDAKSFHSLRIVLKSHQLERLNDMNKLTSVLNSLLSFFSKQSQINEEGNKRINNEYKIIKSIESSIQELSEQIQLDVNNRNPAAYGEVENNITQIFSTLLHHI
eukprot:gene7101-9690_t